MVFTAPLLKDGMWLNYLRKSLECQGAQEVWRVNSPWKGLSSRDPGGDRKAGILRPGELPTLQKPLPWP